MIYEPAEDSFLLSKYVRKLSKNKSLLDMGSGSGIQSQAALSVKAKSVLAIDIDEESLKLLEKNKIPSRKSNLFSNVKEKFDLIAFNPPYLPEDIREDTSSARITSGGKRGDEIIIRFLKKAPRHLEENGIILLILSSLTPQDEISNLLKKSNLKRKVLEKQKLFMESIELWEIKKG